MQILLLTRNHVVRDLVSVALDKVRDDLEVIESPYEVCQDRYDLFFVDDLALPLSKSLSLSRSLLIDKTILLYSEPDALHADFDAKLKKPFLPSEITALLEHNSDDMISHEELEAISLENFLESDEMELSDVIGIELDEPSRQVLDLGEIEKIKALLDDEDPEESDEESGVDESENISSGKKVGQSKSEKKLLKALTKMKPKKIRQLLRGAEVTVTIKFPKR